MTAEGCLCWPQAHTAASKQPLEAYERFAEARMEEVWVIKPNRQAIGKTFKREGKPLQEAIEGLTQEDAACLQARWAGQMPPLVGWTGIRLWPIGYNGPPGAKRVLANISFRNQVQETRLVCTVT